MAGNSQRRNRRNPGSKKGASVGTGGHSRKALQGKGPTPPGEARKATRGVFRNFGRYIIDFYQLPSLGKQELCNRIDFHQWRELHEAFDEGNGTIFVTLHLGQAELGAGGSEGAASR